MSAGRVTGTAAIARAKKRIKKLQALDQTRQARRQEKLQEWFAEFDTNKDQKLQREEFEQLLIHLHPTAPPSEEQLDKLCERATRIESSTLKLAGDKHGAIAWHSVLETVLCYGDYVREERFLNEMPSVWRSLLLPVAFPLSKPCAKGWPETIFIAFAVF